MATVPESFRRGCVIPAHPLALDAERRLDERRQAALTRYYIEAGAGGLAVGVHTTQFAIHDAGVGLYEPVLAIAAATATEYTPDVALVAGVCGPVEQAVREAEVAAGLGYHLVLLVPVAGVDDDGLVERARRVGEVLPVIGFYLQPAVGGRHLAPQFWRRLADVEAVVGIKVAPFDRYRTRDVLNGVAASDRRGEVTLYTGNDDHIVGDLVTAHQVTAGGETVELTFAGGLLGQWAVWTRRAVELLDDVRAARSGDGGAGAVARLLSLGGRLTDVNAAIFDVANGFHGCIAGIHEILVRQGLLAGRWCLDPAEDVSPGQLAAIDGVLAANPDLTDDEFVAANRDRWLS